MKLTMFKPIKKIKIGKKMKLLLPVVSYKSKKQAVSVSSTEVLNIPSDNLEEFQKFQNEIRRREDAKEETFSYAKEIFEMMDIPDFEKDSNGPKKDQSGNTIRRPYTMKEQRMVIKILDAIEDKDPEQKFEEGIEIEIKLKELEFLRDKLEFIYNYLILGVSKQRLELFDYIEKAIEDEKLREKKEGN